MIKLRYDEETGRVGKAYRAELTVPQPYLELTEAENDSICADSEHIYYVINGELVAKSRAEIEKKERIAKLSMTKLDFFKYVISPNGITYEQLLSILATNETMKTAWDLCERIWRGDSILNAQIKIFIPTITDEFLDTVFEEHGKYVSTVTSNEE